ncbi:AcrR family transcriptional regulator [Nocardioides aromaticivorans]|uniref:AcrR family transcriptional regulator n=1 Tax=Nocardioides aromaticivorans TaxID=200618 RepID=A0A7Y9ZLG4_9ACTN|nr:TetR/AcrR family transcriptional regulator [Nocardioides aromaticivorans]NYI47632.1 AcrR family transcriptional regulator [Nocardioides aromaticivorans]QSR26751.1 TetR family transcriptional regulator [Nocardioides aromaticivorans]
MSSESGELLDGRRRRWQEHNQVRRQVIIDAAIAVLERQAPGEDFQVQDVADEAKMSRTVIYRHFSDRSDLDRAVQTEICENIGAQMLPALSYDGTPDQIIHRIVGGFVRWAEAHPSLYWFGERDLTQWGPSPLSQAVQQVAEGIEGIMTIVVAALGVELSEDDRAALDPWVFGMIGAVFAAVRRWLERDVREPSTEATINILSESIWLQINGMALSRGLNLPDLPVADLLQMLSHSTSSDDQ